MLEKNVNGYPKVTLSALGDEAAASKSAELQFASLAAIGLQYYSLRFVDLGSGVKNVMALSLSEIQQLRRLHGDYGLNVASIASPIGKVKLLDVEDGTKNAYLPFKKHLTEDVARACELAHAFESKLIRGFSFYHPKGSMPEEHLGQVVDQLGQIAETCHRSDLTFGVEVEANLVGQNGHLLATIHEQVDHPALALVFDSANLSVQGYTNAEILTQFHHMLPGLGWLHVKDYKSGNSGGETARGHVDEDALKHFVPADEGDGGHEAIFRALRKELPQMETKLVKRGIPGVFVDLEPHLKGGGQFGGYSGPDGLGVALRALTKLLDYTNIDYRLRDFEDVRADRGF